MNQPILVTGASGVLGRALVNTFVEAGAAVRQAVRDPKKARPGVDAVRFDYSGPATFAPAMAGAAGLLLIAPSLDPNAPALLAPVIAEAKRAGVRHIVLNSAFGVNHNEQAPMRVVEHLVIASGIPYTILRPNFFMENFSEGFLAPAIQAQNAIFLAAADGKTSFISVRDIAAMALAAFRAPLAGQEFDLTGPEALSHTEAASIIAQASGRPVTYHEISEEQMAAGARAAGMPEFAVAYLAMLYSVVRAGYAAAVTPDVERATGRKPIGFRQFAAEAWK